MKISDNFRLKKDGMDGTQIKHPESTIQSYHLVTALFVKHSKLFLLDRRENHNYVQAEVNETRLQNLREPQKCCSKIITIFLL